MNLINAELRRLFARRFTRIMMILILGVIGVIAFGIGASSQKITPAVVAEATAQAEKTNQQNAQMLADCEAAAADPSKADPNKFPPGVPCDQIIWHATANDFLPAQVNFREVAPQLVLVIGGLLAMLGFAIGASFVGAEWSSGGMMNLLLWRPRRMLTLLGKLAGLLIGVAGVSVAYALVWVGALWTAASLRGTTANVTSGVWQSVALDNLRAVALGLFAACVGFAVASVGRHTATALGAAVGYLVVFELGLRIVLAIAEIRRPERFFLSNYVGAWLTKASWYEDWHRCENAPGNCEPTHWALHLNQGVIVLGLIVAITVGGALAAMRRRDIT